jgi:hypothetical protein
MAALKSLGNAIQGTLWLVRGAGLRHSVQVLEDNLQHLDEAQVRKLKEITQEISKNSSVERRLSELERWREAGDLRAFENKVFSQNGEDGIIWEILHRVGAETQYFVEFGVESGEQCNCRRLAIQENWRGLFIEANKADFEKLGKLYGQYKNVQCLNDFVTSSNIQSILESNKVPRHLDLLSIDVDGNDYWIWAAIKEWQPRLVVIEYNSTVPPSKKWVMKEDLKHKWDRTNYFGASLASLTALGRTKGYTLVATDSMGINAFFVRHDLVADDKFLDPVVHYHYSPMNHPSCPDGLPIRNGPYVET